jgi:hypothetical protein
LRPSLADESLRRSRERKAANILVERLKKKSDENVDLRQRSAEAARSWLEQVPRAHGDIQRGDCERPR